MTNGLLQVNNFVTRIFVAIRPGSLLSQSERREQGAAQRILPGETPASNSSAGLWNAAISNCCDNLVIRIFVAIRNSYDGLFLFCSVLCTII